MFLFSPSNISFTKGVSAGGAGETSSSAEDYVDNLCYTNPLYYNYKCGGRGYKESSEDEFTLYVVVHKYS